MISPGVWTTPKESTPSVAEGVDGIQLATASDGEGDPEILFVHATGFCKETWDPVIAEMDMQPPSWISIDLRGHGDSAAGPAPNHWDLLGEDIVNVLDGHDDMVGVGHSVGGTAVARAAVSDPTLFRRLVLIEPIVFPTMGERIDGPMSAVARRRRRVFESRDAAKSRFRTGPFAAWTPAALDAYLDGGFRQTDAGFELKCDPEVEADFFMEGSNHDTWDILGGIDIPVTILAADGSSTHREPYLSALVARFKDAELIVLKDATHFMPMEDPDRVAAIIDRAMFLTSP